MEDSSTPPLLHHKALCPGCWGENLIWDESLQADCPDCGIHYRSKKGVWMPVVPDASWRSVVQDTVALFHDYKLNRDAAAEAWREKDGADVKSTMSEFHLSHVEDRDSLFCEVWEMIAASYEVGQKFTILEIGAGELRISGYLASLGHSVVALEPVPEFLTESPYDPENRVVKICCSAGRIPIRDAKFDITICHAALHHIDSIQPILNEMARVTKPGGRVGCVAEPFSARGSNLDNIREAMNDPSFNLGHNERIPRFAEYSDAFDRAKLTNLHTYIAPGDLRLAEKLKRLNALLPHRYLSGNRSLSKLRRGLLNLFHGQHSLWGKRPVGEFPKPAKILPEGFLFDPDLYLGFRHRYELAEIWRRLLTSEEAPRKIVVGENDLYLLRRGFGPRATSSSGMPTRWLLKQGAFFLTVQPGDRRLEILACAGTEEGERFIIQVLQDDITLGVREVSGPKMKVYSWDILTVDESTPFEFLIFSDQVKVTGTGAIRSIAIARIDLVGDI